MDTYIRVQGVILYDDGAGMQGFLGLEDMSEPWYWDWHRADLLDTGAIHPMRLTLNNKSFWTCKISLPNGFENHQGVKWNTTGRNKNFKMGIDHFCEAIRDERGDVSLRALSRDEALEDLCFRMCGTVIDVDHEHPSVAMVQVYPGSNWNRYESPENFIKRMHGDDRLKSVHLEKDGEHFFRVNLDVEKYMFRAIDFEVRFELIGDQLVFKEVPKVPEVPKVEEDVVPAPKKGRKAK